MAPGRTAQFTSKAVVAQNEAEMGCSSPSGRAGLSGLQGAYGAVPQGCRPHTNAEGSFWGCAMRHSGHVEGYLYHPDSVVQVARIDQNVATRVLPGHDTSDHCRIHTVLLANSAHHGLISQKVRHIYFSQPFRSTNS